MAENIKRSVLAGILISTGGCIYLACAKNGLAWVGALLFTVGLYTICEYGFNLYTGKVGYVAERFRDVKYIGFVASVLLVNLLTTFAAGALVSVSLPDIAAQARTVYAAKLEGEPLQWLVSSVFCGMLMFIAVDTFRRGSRLGMFLCVPAFILAGFDHSIANSFYNGAALGEGTFTLENLAFVVIVVLGNALGGMLIPLLTRSRKKRSGTGGQ